MIKKITLAVIAHLISLHAYTQAVDTTALYDFWVGKWEASWDEGNEQVGTGTNNIVKILDGKVIQENFQILTGQNKGFKGTSISVFNPRTKEWKQAWADNQGGYYDFTGNADGDKRIFQTTPKNINGKTVIQRMVFYNISNDAFTWDWEGTQDGGENWNLLWRINYKKSS